MSVIRLRFLRDCITEVRSRMPLCGPVEEFIMVKGKRVGRLHGRNCRTIGSRSNKKIEGRVKRLFFLL
jgi:hypothetical protein